jgi:hypothetical protein
VPAIGAVSPGVLGQAAAESAIGAATRDAIGICREARIRGFSAQPMLPTR